MTPRFILDENVVICAQTGTDDHGNPSTLCTDLIELIIDICHPIVVDDVLWGKYEDQLYSPRYQDASLGPAIMRDLWNAYSIPDKIDGLGRLAETFEGEDTIPAGSQDDTYIVRLAVESGAILVTTDEALRDDLRECGIEKARDLTIVSPGEALGHL